MSVAYARGMGVSAQEFRDVLIHSGLAERRPAEDLARLERMLQNADIVVTARDEGKLVGISRAVTDYAYCCYLSDLAVDRRYQKQGIGTRLIRETHAAAGPQTALILVSAPAAEGYYPKIGMKSYPCFGIPRSE